MTTRMKLAILVIALVVVGIPVLSKLRSQDAAQKPAETPTGKAAAANAPPGVDASAAPLLNATNLANTAWNIPIKGMPVTFNLLPGGTLKAVAPVLGELQGTWSVDGATLTVSAVYQGKPQTMTAKIAGNNILVDGKPVQRVQ